MLIGRFIRYHVDPLICVHCHIDPLNTMLTPDCCYRATPLLLNRQCMHECCVQSPMGSLAVAEYTFSERASARESYDSHMTGPNRNVTGTEKAQKVWSGYIAVMRLTWSYDILLSVVYLSYTCHITCIWHICGHIPLIYQSCAMYTHEPGI